MAIIGSLYKLCDVLQMPLRYDGAGGVTGSAKVLFKPLDGLSMELQLTARAIFHREQVGVLAHMAGNLYIMIAHNPEKGGISAFLLDAAKVPNGDVASLIQKNMNLREAVGAVREAIVEAFALQQGRWSILKLPKVIPDAHGVDQRKGGRAPEGDRDGHIEVRGPSPSPQGT